MAVKPDRGRSRSLGLLLCASGIEGCWLGVLALGDLRQHLPAFVALLSVAFAGYLAASWLTYSGRGAMPFSMLLVCAGVFRVTMLVAPPTLSDDLYRTVWEGRVLLAGYSPYQYAPGAPELAPLRNEVWLAVNNKSVPSPYPPLVHAYSVATAVLSPDSTFGPKLLSTLLDGAIIVALIGWLHRLGKPVARMILYAWSPLPILEFGHSGHNDAVMVLLLVISLAAAGRRSIGPVMLAAAVLAKIVPLTLIPLLLSRWRLYGLGYFVATVILGYVPLVVLGNGSMGSLFTYASTWSDNDSLFFLLRLVASLVVADTVLAAKVLSVAILAVGIGLLARHPTAVAWPLPRRALWCIGLFLALSSTVHAWYLTWLLPLLTVVLEPGSRPLTFQPVGEFGWLIFSGLAILPYLTYADHQWQIWISAAEYLPLYAILAVAAVPTLREWVMRLRERTLGQRVLAAQDERI